jgi:N-acetylneuraminic acid mutarotase
VTDAQGKPVREWLRDAYRYTPESGWKRIADLPRVAVAAPTPAPRVGNQLLVIGGDDGAQVSVAPTEHKGFPRDILAYDSKADVWTRAGEVPFSLVTTTLAEWRGRIVIPGGEQKPGVRSPAVWAADLK